MLKIEKFLLTFAAIASLGILFVLAPIIALFIALDPNTFYKTWIADSLLSSQARDALLLTLEAAFASSLVLTIIGIPLSYFLTRYSFRGKNIVEAIIDIPLMIPHAVAGIMIMLAYSRRGLLGPFLSLTGIRIEDSFWGIVATMMFVSFPIMIDTLKLGYLNIDESIELVARSMGASRLNTFVKITLPLLVPSIVAGFLLSWARAVSEVGAILIVAYYPKSINILVFEWFNTYGLKYAVSLSFVLVLFSLVVFILLKTVVRK